MVLLAASILPTLVTCTNCQGVGSIEYTCERCSGSGLVDPPKSFKLTRGSIDRLDAGKLPCPDCVKGLSSKSKKGTGKKRRVCKVCFGKKRIRAK